MNPVDAYLREVDCVPRVPFEEQATLAASLWHLEGDPRERVRKRLLEANLYVVVGIARQYERSGSETFDLIIEGNIGLLRAIQTCIPDNAKDFAGHVDRCVTEAIARAAGRPDWQ